MNRPNILVICVDQWQARMKLPKNVRLPAIERLRAQGVSQENFYCAVPICTPTRATMWTGQHAKNVDVADNTNFAWSDDLSTRVKTIGHMMREQGYYTAFKGKWHVSEVPPVEGALEKYGFSDFQQWGEMFGAPLEGIQLDGAAAFEAMDWLKYKRASLNQPWMFIFNLISPHDIMFYQADPIEEPHPNGMLAGIKTTEQGLGWFAEDWPVELPANFHDDLLLQPQGVREFKAFMELNYGRIPPEREDLWLKRTNYYINNMRLADYEIQKILRCLDEYNVWEDTVVVFTSDHGEMNGAHGMVQKGAIPFDEAAVVHLTACVPEGPAGKRTSAVGSHLDFAPTFLEFAGLAKDEIRKRYPALKGNSLRDLWLNPSQPGPRGSAEQPGNGALYCWDGLHELDKDWGISGALNELTILMGPPPTKSPEERMREVGRKYGAPDFSKRTFYRAVTDGRYKLVRWFSPEEYGNPSTLDELYASADVALYDLANDPGELENIGHPEHREHDSALVQRMLDKLHALVNREIGEDHAPFDLNMFGTREIKYAKPEPTRERTQQRKEERRGPDLHP